VTRTFGLIGIPGLLGLVLLCHGPAEAADRSHPVELSNEQLDKVSAAATTPEIYFSTAEGNSDATGTSARTAVTVTSIVGTAGQVNSVASGAASASATSATSAGPMATANSSLSLFVTNP